MKDCKGEHSSSRETVNVSILQELLSLEERLGNVNRGATQDIIEMNTLPYKYKKVSKGGGGVRGGFVHTKKYCWQCVLWGQVVFPVVIRFFFPFVFGGRGEGE